MGIFWQISDFETASLWVCGSHRVMLLRSPFKREPGIRNAASWQPLSVSISREAPGQGPGSAGTRAHLFWPVQDSFADNLCTRLPCWADQALLQKHSTLKLFLSHLLSFPFFSWMSDLHCGLKSLPAYSHSLSPLSFTGVNRNKCLVSNFISASASWRTWTDTMTQTPLTLLTPPPSLPSWPGMSLVILFFMLLDGKPKCYTTTECLSG